MKFFKTLTLLSVAIIGSNAMKNISSKKLVKELKIGWNLGNTLDSQCIDSIDYASNQLASETCWGNPKATKALYKKLSSLGFNTFRIPTTWSGHFGKGPHYKINPTWMKRVHEVVDYALSTKGYAILNIHHETWNYAYSSNLNSAKPILVALWKQIAAEFANYDEHLIFEGMNEPRKVGDANEWNGGDVEGWNFVNEMNALFVKTVRATGGNNKIRHLMIPTYAASVEVNALAHLKIPQNDNKIIVSLHSYSPYNFALNSGNGSVSTFNDGNEIDYITNNIKNYFISKNIPVIIGEFGAVNRNNEMERAKWANYYVKKFASIGVPCVLWDNGIFDGDGETFGMINRSTLQVVYPSIINNLMSAAKSRIVNKPVVKSTSKPKVTKKVTVTKAKSGNKGKVVTKTKVVPKTKSANKAKPINKTKIVTKPKKVIKTKIVTKPKKVNKTKVVTKSKSKKANNKTINKNKTTTNKYFSCKSNDVKCKRKMRALCYSDALKCYKSGKSNNKCNKISMQCLKIMKK